MSDRRDSPLTHRGVHVLVVLLFCLLAAHTAQAHILPLMQALRTALSGNPLH
jgi:hypothetical protein